MRYFSIEVVCADDPDGSYQESWVSREKLVEKFPDLKPLTSRAGFWRLEFVDDLISVKISYAGADETICLKEEEECGHIGGEDSIS